jgi:Cu/Ag efflux protein CusF
MKRLTVALIVVGFLSADVPATFGQASKPPAEAPAAKPSVSEATAVKLRGTITAVDKENKTISIKGEGGRTLTLDVQDPSKLEAVKVGDPVVGMYYEAVAVRVRKAEAGTPGMTVKEERATSKPGETPAGAVGREITVTGTITAIDKKQGSVTVKGPQGKSHTVKVKEPKNLENVKVGDLIELTYAQALVVALDKAAKVDKAPK